MKILGSDYDGTLSHHGITDEKLKAIENWRNKGNKFGIVSGRGKTFRSELLQEHPNLRIDFFAACNGAYITDADDNVIFEKRCSDVSLPKFADDLFEWGCKCVHVNAERYVCIVQKAEHRPAWVSERVTCLPEDVPSFDYFNQVSVQLPSVEDSTIVVEKIRNKYSKWLNPLQNSVCIDIVPAGINKAEGLYRVMEYYGGEYKDMITVGDNINDIDMIREFRSYAMKNGVEAVKNLASGIVSDVIEILEKEI